jgi:drug/metabolite transporter (DMT)-like permease
MQKIKRSQHRFLDYLLGATLIITPFVFNFEDVTAAFLTFLIIGLLIILYSGLTDYLFNVGKIISFKLHLVFDALAGAVLIAAPWMFMYRAEIVGVQLGVHILLGIVLFVLAGFSEKRVKGDYQVQMPGPDKAA